MTIISYLQVTSQLRQELHRRAILQVGVQILRKSNKTICENTKKRLSAYVEILQYSAHVIARYWEMKIGMGRFIRHCIFTIDELTEIINTVRRKDNRQKRTENEGKMKIIRTKNTTYNHHNVWASAIDRKFRHRRNKLQFGEFVLKPFPNLAKH